MHAITVTPFVTNKKGARVDNVFQTSYGALKVMDLVGLRYGHQVQLSRGWAVLLHPTPELWTLTLPHRTQILYSADMSLIVTELGLEPGSVVCEAGTGSGSLSHVIARTVAPSGRLLTFDFHEQRAATAKDEFDSHGLSSVITSAHRDVCSDGFGVSHVADAVFLDLPRPWDVVKFAVKALKTAGGRLCSFSPCVEQTQRTCAELHRLKFTDIVTVECLQREFQARRITLPTLDLPTQDKAVLVDSGSDSESRDANKICARVPESSRSILTAVPLTRMTGHTGYLTFATLPPHSPTLS